MPAKRSARREPKRRHIPAVRPSTAKTPLASFKPLHDEVQAWLQTTFPGMTADAVATLINDMDLAISLAQEHAELRHLGIWTADRVGAVIEATAHLHEQPSERPHRAVAALAQLTAFLRASGRWDGLLDELVDVRALLVKASPAMAYEDDIAALLWGPEDEATAMAEARALAGLPLTRHLEALVRWVAETEPETGGAYQPLPEDLPQLAALVGLHVDPSAPPTRLAHVPRLHALWWAMHDSGPTYGTQTRIACSLDEDDLASDAPLEEDLLPMARGVVRATLRDTTDFPERARHGTIFNPPISATALAALPDLVELATGRQVTARVLAASDARAGTGTLLRELRDLGLLCEGTEPGSLVVIPGLEKVLAVPVLGVLDAEPPWRVAEYTAEEQAEWEDFWDQLGDIDEEPSEEEDEV